MMQPPDHELDKLINEAGDKHHVTGANPDWEKMQALLDKHMPVKKEPRRMGFILLAVLLLFLLGGTYLYFYKNNDKSSGLKEQQALTNPATPVPSQPVNPIIKGTAVTDSQKKQTSSIQNKPTIQKQNKTTLNSNGHPKNKTSEKIKINTYAAGIAEDNLPGKANEIAAVPDNDENVITTINETPETLTATTELSKLTNNLPDKKVTPGVAITENKKTGDTTKTSGNKKNKTNEKTKHPLEFTLVYAPELTTIRFSNIDKPGSNYGLLVGYRVSKNITLQTGVIKSRKNYIANGNDFDQGYPQTASHKLTKVKGYCVMYEIPLNVKSQISCGKKFNLFYTAGISSYFMKSEFYTYYYSTSSGDYSKSVLYNSQRNYWLSLATLGLGVEKEIANNLSIAATPFLKIPFKGMGEGKLKLLSTGINFSLSYKPSFSKK